MDLNKKLDLLKQITEVDAPPFLLTRIKHQLRNVQQAEAPVKWKWAFAVTSIVILLLNISMLFTSSFSGTKKNTGIESIVRTMNLSTENDLYNE
jgi:hypothetical protein